LPPAAAGLYCSNDNTNPQPATLAGCTHDEDHMIFPASNEFEIRRVLAADLGGAPTGTSEAYHSVATRDILKTAQVSVVHHAALNRAGNVAFLELQMAHDVTVWLQNANNRPQRTALWFLHKDLIQPVSVRWTHRGTHFSADSVAMAIHEGYTRTRATYSASSAWRKASTDADSRWAALRIAATNGLLTWTRVGRLGAAMNRPDAPKMKAVEMLQTVQREIVKSGDRGTRMERCARFHELLNTAWMLGPTPLAIVGHQERARSA
jgi:hypothetical protein